MSLVKSARYLPALCALALGLGACQAIAGIEDRTYEPTGPVVSAACQSYCDKVMANCTGAFRQYEQLAECLGICAHFEPGDALEPKMDNTLACRAKFADLAGPGGEPDIDCPAAGPGGNGTCGSNCESFCALQAAICPPGEANCVALCAGLVPSTSYNSSESAGDSLACRLYHVSAASVEPDPHCSHATLRPNGPCIDPDNTPPTCGEFCQLEMTVCQGANAVYQDVNECKAVCGALDLGTTNDHTQNTVGCRFYHSYNALAQPDIHCSHTGPGGDGHCGADDPAADTGNCVSYCKVVAKACDTLFSSTFATPAACLSSCDGLAGAAHDSTYSLATAASGNTVQCRLYHAAAALLSPNDPTECNAALGLGAPCR